MNKDVLYEAAKDVAHTVFVSGMRRLEILEELRAFGCLWAHKLSVLERSLLDAIVTWCENPLDGNAEKVDFLAERLGL